MMAASEGPALEQRSEYLAVQLGRKTEREGGVEEVSHRSAKLLFMLYS